MKYRTLVATGLPLVIFTILAGLCFFLVSESGAPQRFSVAVSLSASLLHVYALVLFVRGFRYFKQELRTAYTLLSVGIAFLGIAIAQLPIINLFNLSFWTDSGAMLIPYLIAVIPTLLGMGRFARSLGLHTKWLSLPIVGVSSILLGSVAIFIPYVSNTTPEVDLRTAIALTIVICTFFVASTVGTIHIRHKASTSYTSSLNWLVVALTSAAIGAFIYMLELLLSGSRGWYYEWSMTILYFNLTGWLFLRAGYAFSVIGSSIEPVQKQQNASSVDIILYVEGLASNPIEVDPIVDALRAFTAEIGANHKVTAADQIHLLEIYRKLEDYLVTNEPLRKLSRQEIREAVEHRLGVDATSTQTFWPQLKTST